MGGFLILTFLLCGLIIYSAYTVADKLWPIKPIPISDLEMYKTAVHESSHAICCYLCTRVDCVKSVEIHDRGGVVLYHHGDGLDDELKWSLAVNSLAGLAGEIVYYKKIRSGPAKHDLLNALDLVRRISIDYNPPIFSGQSLDFSKMFTVRLTAREKFLLETAYKQAKEIIVASRQKIDKLSQLLYKKRYLTSDDLEEVLGNRTLLLMLGLFKTTSFVYPKAG